MVISERKISQNFNLFKFIGLTNFYCMKKFILSILSIFCFVIGYSQTRVLSGTVEDSHGLPLPGVTIMVSSTSSGTITDADGRFEIRVENASGKNLVFSYIGYTTLEQPIGNATTFRIVLLEDRQLLDELVVVGYGVQKKRLVTGATSQVSGEDVQRLNTVSTLDALKSNTTGVQIVKASGLPGSDYKINIRGLGTTGNATPLFIVDGVPVSSINFLNPADIESTDILKDAASAAIYGSRAANGVILITTKTGKFDQKPSISYDMYYGVQNIYKHLDLLNAKDYAMITAEGQANDGLPPLDFNAMVPNWSAIQSGQFIGTDWVREASAENAPIQNHALNISGGSEKANYSAGLSYTKQNGIIGKQVNPYYERYTGRLNLEQRLLQLNGRDFLKSGQSLIYTYTNSRQVGVGGIYWNMLRNLIVMNPFMPVYDANGKYHYALPWESGASNPIGNMDYEQGQNNSKNHNLIATAFLELSPIENLTIRSTFGYNHSSSSYRSFEPVYDLGPRDNNPENRVSQSMSNGMAINFENTINYVRDFNNHDFDFLVGNTIQKSGMGLGISGSNVNSIFDDFKHAYLTNTPNIVAGKTSLSGSPWGENKLLSYFGRINYNYMEKYLLTLVMRADGSSKFARGNRWGYFPSIAAGWVVSDESFMSDASWADFFKLRASWGQNGNQNIPTFQYLSTISFSGAEAYFLAKNRVYGAYPNVLPNPDITWETSEQLNIGFDSRFLSNRLDVTFDLYRKVTKDWLIDAPILASFGTGAPFINGGNVENRGVELGVNWRDNVGQLNYNVGVNVSYNQNEVTKINNTEGIIHGPAKVPGELMTESFRAQVGFPIGYFWGYKTDGIFQNEQEVLNYKNSKGELIQPDARPGDVRFVNTNDDNEISDADKVMIGDPNPDFTFGLNLGVNYKGFFLSVTGNGTAGNQIMRNYRTPDKPKNNYTYEIMDRWHGEGTSNRIPRVTMGTHINRQYVSDLYIEDGDYLRISNITFGYELGKINTAIPIEQIRLYVTLQNAYTFTNYKGMDPEIGFDGGISFGSGIDVGFYPAPRTLMFGTSIQF